MFLLRRPAPAQVQALLTWQRGEKYTYTEVGLTRDDGPSPSGYALDRHTARLGVGDECFARAREAALEDVRDALDSADQPSDAL